MFPISGNFERPDRIGKLTPLYRDFLATSQLVQSITKVFSPLVFALVRQKCSG